MHKMNYLEKNYYQVRQEPLQNKVVEELNASVLPLTFKRAKGLQPADVYEIHGCAARKIVANGHCGPVDGVKVATVLIQF